MKRTDLIFGTVALAVLTLASCNDEMLNLSGDEVFTEVSEELQNNASSAEIITRGECDTLWIGVNRNVEYDLYRVTTEDNPNALSFTDARGNKVYIEKSGDFSLVQRGKCMITTEIPQDAANEYVAALRIKGETATFPMLLSVRSMTTRAAAAESANTDAARNLRAAEYLCHPIAFDTVPAVDKSVVWLDKNMIADGAQAAAESNAAGTRIKPALTNLLNAVSWQIKTTGKSTDKEDKSWSEETGLSFKIPIVGMYLSASTSYSKSQKRNSDVEREWCRWTTMTVAMTANIDKDLVKQHPAYYLSTGLNDVLNTQKSRVVNMYPMTLEGTFKLIDDYGLFLSTTGAFGAYSSYEYERQANISSLSVEEAGKANMGLAKYGDAGSSIGDAIVYFAKLKYGINTAAAESVVNASFTGGNKEYHKAVSASSSTIMFGGNCMTETDVSKWNATTDPENWNLVSFSTNGAVDDDGKNLLTLLDMIQDPNSERGLLMKKALYTDASDESTYLSADCPYAKHLVSKLKTSQPTKTVVCDVYLQMLGKAGQDKVLKDNPKSFVMEDSKGRKHIYQPFIINQNAGHYVTGGAANMLGYGFMVGCGKSETQYWGMWWDFVDGNYSAHSSDLGKSVVLYYALDDYKHCNALSDVFFGDPAAATFFEGYMKRGYDVNAAFNTGENRAVFVKYVSDEDEMDINYPHITALALVAGNRKKNFGGMPSWQVGVPFATTAGTEWLPDDKTVFDYYWNTANDSVYNTIADYQTLTINVCNVNAQQASTRRYRADEVSKLDIRGNNTLRQGWIKSIGDVYGNGQENYNQTYCIDGKQYTTTHTSTLYGKTEKTCVHINYTTKRLDPNHLTAPRQAKLWP